MPILLAALVALAVPQSDPVADAVKGLAPLEIEDDNGPDMPMTGMSSAGCTVTVNGQSAKWDLDMAKTAALSLEDTFVYVAAGPHKLAIVGDASKPDQAAKLKALATVLVDIAKRCMPADARGDGRPG